MIRISITVEAFEAIVPTLPVGSVAYKPERTEKRLRESALDLRNLRPQLRAQQPHATLLDWLDVSSHASGPRLCWRKMRWRGGSGAAQRTARPRRLL
jgi:hypothetical protein